MRASTRPPLARSSGCRTVGGVSTPTYSAPTGGKSHTFGFPPFPPPPPPIFVTLPIDHTPIVYFSIRDTAIVSPIRQAVPRCLGMCSCWGTASPSTRTRSRRRGEGAWPSGVRSCAHSRSRMRRCVGGRRCAQSERRRDSPTRLMTSRCIRSDQSSLRSSGGSPSKTRQGKRVQAKML